MIYDTFIFYNELDILDIRLHELNSVVDKFVICEAPITFMGRPKEFIFEKYKKKFSKFLNKIIYYKIPLSKLKQFYNNDGKVTNPWLVEFYQRDYAFNEMLKNNIVFKNDIFICGDIDEIPDRNIVIKFLNDKLDKAQIITKLFRYYYNLYFQDWKHLFICDVKTIINFDGVNNVRRNCNNFPLLAGGWHFSSVGNIDQIMNKLSNFSHAKEHKDKINIKRIKSRIERRLHPIKNNKNKGCIVSINNMPEYIRKNKSHFKNLLLKREKENE